MEPKFEQFKKLEMAIETVPTVKPEAHFELNDIAKKVVEGMELSQEDSDFLNSVYSSLQGLEVTLMDYFDDYRAAKILSKEEFLVAADYFLLAKQNGPDSEAIIQLMKERRIGTEGFDQIIKDVSMPEHTRTVLMNVYAKLY